MREKISITLKTKWFDQINKIRIKKKKETLGNYSCKQSINIYLSLIINKTFFINKFNLFLLTLKSTTTTSNSILFIKITYNQSIVICII